MRKKPIFEIANWRSPASLGVRPILDRFLLRRYSDIAKSYKVLTLYTMDITTMRKTKVYSITMPPEMARQAESLAKKESRTMSELMREAFRRYQLQQAQEQLLTDPLRLTRLQALKQSVTELRNEAAESGISKLSKRELDNVIK